MIIVEDEQSILLLLCKFVEQERQSRLWRLCHERWLRGFREERQRSPSQSRIERLAGRNDRAPEAEQVVVAAIERNPCQRSHLAIM
jgi:hypothetical protein